MLGTVVPENNKIPMPVPEVFRHEVVPLTPGAEPPIVKTHSEGQTVEPNQEQEQERAKNLPAEASASSAEPGTSDHDADAPMTDVFEASLRDLHTRRSHDGEGGRLCC